MWQINKSTLRNATSAWNFSAIEPANELKRSFIPGSLIDTIFGIMWSPASTPDDGTVNMKDFKSHSYAKSNVTTHRQNYFFFCHNTKPSLSDKALIKCVACFLNSKTSVPTQCSHHLQWDKPAQLSHNLSGAALHNSAPVITNTKSTMLL